MIIEIGQGHERDELYYFNPCSPIAYLANYSSLLDLWHICLEHPSKDHLHALVPMLLINSNKLSKICNIYPLTKQTKLSFPVFHLQTNNFSLFIVIYGTLFNFISN